MQIFLFKDLLRFFLVAFPHFYVLIDMSTVPIFYGNFQSGVKGLVQVHYSYVLYWSRVIS